MDAFKKQTPEITKEVNDLFSKIKPDEKFKYLLNDVYHSDTFKNTNFKEFVDGMDSATKRTITAGDALSQYKTHLQSADKASSKFGSTLKSIGGSIASGLANFAIGAAIGFAIDSVIKAIDYFTVTYDELQSAFQNSQSNYSSAKAEVESVQTELEQINTQIDAINSQPLTLSSEAELARLQSEKSELEEILSVKQSIADASRQKLALDAYKASKAETSLNEGRKAGQSDTTKGFMDFENWMMSDELIPKLLRGLNPVSISAAKKYNSFTDAESVIIYSKKLNELKKQQEDVYEWFTSSEGQTGKEYGTKAFDLKQKELERVSNGIADLQTEITTKRANIAAQIEAMTDENTGKAFKGMETQVDYLKNSLNDLDHIEFPDMSQAEKSLNSIDKFFGKTSSVSIKNHFQQLANAGKLTEEAIEKVGISASTIGVDNLSDVVKYFNDMATSADNASNSISKIDGSFEGVTSAFETANQGNEWDAMSQNIAKAHDMLKEGLVGTDDFQTVAQWMSPHIINKDDPKYKYDADAYVEAWQNAYNKVVRWFDSENPLQSMHNFAHDLDNTDLANITYDANGALMEVIPTFKNTAEAADKLGVSTNAVETAMRKLEEYGFEWDGVLFSGEGLDEYKGYLDQIKSITKELDDGREKSRLQKLIAGWDEEYAKYQNDLSLLTDDQIVKIKFEYDMSTIQQKIDELDEQWKSGNRSAEIGAGRIAAQKMYRDKKEEKYGYTAGFDEKYGKLNEQIKLIESSFNDDMTEKQREQAQDQISAILDIQNDFQDAFSDGEVVDWNNYLNTDGFQEAVNAIMSETGISRIDLAKFLGIDVSQLGIRLKEDLANELEQLTNGQTIKFNAEIDGLSSDVEALKNQDGTITYTAEVDGVEQRVFLVQNQDGTITFTAETEEVDKVTSVVDGGVRTVEYVASTSGLPNFFPSITRTVNYVASGVSAALNAIRSASGKASANGTAYNNGSAFYYGTAFSEGSAMWQHFRNASGKSYAGGNWGLYHDANNALINELGGEILVRDGHWSILNDGYPTLANLKKNDIIFNHEQSKALLTKGYLTGSHGKLAFAGGSAFATGGRLPVPETGGYGYGTSSGNSSTPASNSNSNSNSNSDSDKEFKEKIDEIEILLDRMESSLQRLTDSIETYSYDLSKQSEVSTQAMNQIRINLGTLQQAYNRYIQEANSVGLDESWKQKVQNGAVNIETIQNEDLKKSIDEYTKW